MIDYSQVYLRISGDPTFWIVDKNGKRPLADMGEVYRIGLRKIVVVSQEEFDAIEVGEPTHPLAYSEYNKSTNGKVSECDTPESE
jgi:hypothetical protein